MRDFIALLTFAFVASLVYAEYLLLGAVHTDFGSVPFYCVLAGCLGIDLALFTVIGSCSEGDTVPLRYDGL